ncbi:MAG: hypothetical protein IJA32_09310 [Lachnospiraceae bacterium]|nr:hypothetical protein [Lachnospiraceae bacterium]
MIKSRKENEHCNCVLIKQGELKTLSPKMKYYLYEYEDGSIHCETLSATFDISKSKEEYEKLSDKELESMIYSAEMSIAR